MAVKGSRTKSIAKVKKPKPGAGSGKKTERISPQEISKFKNEVQKQKSKANLAITARYNKYTLTGTTKSVGGREYAKVGVPITINTNLKKPKIKVGKVSKRSGWLPRQVSGRRKLIEQKGMK